MVEAAATAVVVEAGGDGRGRGRGDEHLKIANGAASEAIFLRKYVLHCNENPIYVFPKKELPLLSPNFHIHVSVSDLYIPRIGPHTIFSCSRIGRPIIGVYNSLTDT